MENDKQIQEGEKVTIYFVRYAVPGKKTMVKTRWRMTPEEAAKQFAGVKYEIVEGDSLTYIRDGRGRGNFTDNWPVKSE